MLVGAGLYAASAVVGRGNAHTLEPDAGGVTLSADGWDAHSPPGLEFLFEARVQLHLPAMDVGPTPDGQRAITIRAADHRQDIRALPGLGHGQTQAVLQPKRRVVDRRDRRTDRRHRQTQQDFRRVFEIGADVI